MQYSRNLARTASVLHVQRNFFHRGVQNNSDIPSRSRSTSRSIAQTHPMSTASAAAAAAAAPAEATTTKTKLTDLFASKRVNSMQRDLRIDPESASKFPNRTPREVHGGHFVHTSPQGLTQPSLVLASEFFAEECLGLHVDELNTPLFAEIFSGNLESLEKHVDDVLLTTGTWATPYAVSVAGQEITAPDPFGTGNGYGDGRAMSIGEFIGLKNEIPNPISSTPPQENTSSVNTPGRWELQLKGAGTTPFSRGADGRAVLRSSVREYLACNAMHHLGVPSTLALSLVVSRNMTVDRPWYPPSYKGAARPPMVMQTEQCAITTRAAPSFLRIGQFELFARRVRRGVAGARADLVKLVRHAIEREYPHVSMPPLQPTPDAPTPVAFTVESTADVAADSVALIGLLRSASESLIHTVVEWVRVGYVQGNMNSDNMLISGRTMDYGPFGFIECFSPMWSPFTSDPEKNFGFLRQPQAMQINVVTFARALVVLAPDDDELHEKMQKVVGKEYAERVQTAMTHMERRKLGLMVADRSSGVSNEVIDELWVETLQLMFDIRADYTIFWRILSSLADLPIDQCTAKPLWVSLYPPATCGTTQTNNATSAETRQSDPEFEPTTEMQEKLEIFVKKWRALKPNAKVMKEANPKYVLREWMLVDAYTAAQQGDYSVVKQIEALVASPYAEKREGGYGVDDESEMERKYFRRTPPDMQEKGGVSFFS